MGQVGISGQYQLPNYISQVLLDHTKAVHDALGIDYETLSNLGLKCGVSAWRNGVQSIPQNTWTKILWNAEEFDIGGDFRADGANSDFTAPTNGYYLVIPGVSISVASADKYSRCAVYKEGANIKMSEQITTGTVPPDLLNPIAMPYLTIGQVITIYVHHTDVAPVNIVGTQTQTWLYIARIRG